jgi:lipid-binding SYLF domain-containing protein
LPGFFHAKKMQRLLTRKVSPQVHVQNGIIAGTPVTCRENSPGGYSTHLPQNLGDGVGHGYEGHRIQPFIIFPHLLTCFQLPTDKIIFEGIMKFMFRVVLLALLLTGMSFSETAAGRVESAATVLNEIMATPDKGIPEEILGSAKCVAVVPSLIKGGFVVGGAHGRGMATCRIASGWSAPAPLTTTGGSVGLQIGGQAVDLVMVIMNDRGMTALLTSKFKLGADISVAAGPVGRHAEGSTDWKMRAEVLTYSRARGLFAGISLNGAAIKQDEDATRELYGRMVDFKTILTGSVPTPQPAEPFVAAVRKAVGSDTTAASSSSSKTPPPPPPASSAPVNPPAAPAQAPATTPANEAPANEQAPAASPSPTPPPFQISKATIDPSVI